MQDVIKTETGSRLVMPWPPSWKTDMTLYLCCRLSNSDKIWYADAESHADDDGIIIVETENRISICRRFIFRDRKYTVSQKTVQNCFCQNFVKYNAKVLYYIRGP